MFQFENGKDNSLPSCPGNYNGSGTVPQLTDIQGTESDADNMEDIMYKDDTMANLLSLRGYIQKQKPPTPAAQSGDSDNNGNHSHSNIDDPDEMVKHGPCGPYHNYQDNQWNDTVYMLINNFGKMSMTEAVEKNGINGHTECGRLGAFLENPSTDFPANKPHGGGGAGHPKILQQEHTDFILEYFADKPYADVFELQEVIKMKYGIEVSESTLYQHFKKECALSLQWIQAQPEVHFSEAILEHQKTWVKQWPSRDAFLLNSVFINEAGFQLYMRQLCGWSQRGGVKVGGKDKGMPTAEPGQVKPACHPLTVKVPKLQSVNFTVIGAICWYDILNLTLWTPKMSPPSNKKRGASGKNKEEEEFSCRTTAKHFTAFISMVMVELDAHGMKNVNLVMDNASIHKSEYVQELINLHGHIPVYLPAYSLFLNPIEEFWAEMKLHFWCQELQRT